MTNTSPRFELPPEPPSVLPSRLQANDLPFLSRLAGLQLLNLSLGSGMQQAPPQLALLTNLVVLHLDESSLEALPESLSALVRLQILG